MNAQGKPNDIRLAVLIRYDLKEINYRMWTFISNGRLLTALGSWDEATPTMFRVTEYDEELVEK